MNQHEDQAYATPEQPTAPTVRRFTVSYSRKYPLRQYESAELSVYATVEVGDGDPVEAIKSTLADVTSMVHEQAAVEGFHPKPVVQRTDYFMGKPVIDQPTNGRSPSREMKEILF